MLCGDGCLTTRTRKEGYKTYSIEFFNTNNKMVENFADLFFDLFSERGSITSYIKGTRKRLYVFRKYSHKIFEEITKKGFQRGKKKYKLKIPGFVFRGTYEEKKEFFKGYLITDGCLRKNLSINFHSGGRLFLEDLSKLISDLWGIEKGIKEYAQKERHLSYQLNLNRREADLILSKHPNIATVA